MTKPSNYAHDPANPMKEWGCPVKELPLESPDFVWSSEEGILDRCRHCDPDHPNASKTTGGMLHDLEQKRKREAGDV